MSTAENGEGGGCSKLLEPTSSRKSETGPAVAVLERLAARAPTGDPAAVVDLRRVLDKNPDIWQSVGDLSAHVERTFISLLAGRNELVAESIRRQISALRRSLGYGSDTPAQRLLADEIVACWLAVK